jgi:uncharacterized protein
MPSSTTMCGALMPNFSRRDVLRLAASSAAGLILTGKSYSDSYSPPNSSRDLAPTAFRALPLGEIRPAGWLLRQLQVQADGMSGHLDEFWPDVGPDSGWLGGSGESWERGPYYLDGLVPLAYLLDDKILKTKAQKFIDWTLENQRPNGMIGPTSNVDWWPRMVMAKVLAQYYEATRDPRVLPALTHYFHYQLAEMTQRPLQSWGRYRWQDEGLIVEWLYEKTHDASLLQLLDLLKRQGYDWESQFVTFRYTTPTPRSYLKGGLSDEAMQTHGVNNAQALKVSAVQYRVTGDTNGRAAFFRQLAALDKYHGMPNGMFSCDEHLGGLEPQHGTELCSVVETMFSLEVALATFGDATIADRIEKIAFNALPGTFTDDMWAHQYDQQSNQVQVGLLSKPWTTNGPESNLYGLEPHFGCCTANFHQGWPKFTANLWMRTGNGGLAATLFAPNEVRTSVQGIAIHVVEETDYPFRSKVRFTITPAKPVSFSLSFRIPGWVQEAGLKLNGKPIVMPLKAGTFADLDRVWHPGDTVELEFPMKPRLTRWFNRSVALERGPLVFSLDPGEMWVKLRDRVRTADWQVFPTSQWNYALSVDEATVAELRVTEEPISDRPFSSIQTPVRIWVQAKLVDGWRSQDGVASAPPESPAKSDEPEVALSLVPYASAKLRITAFPSLSS